MRVHQLTHEITNTSAIFGRNQNVNVVFEGTVAKTNGSEIVLPALPDSSEITEEAARVLRGYTDHEAGHIRHTDFNALSTIDKDGKSPLRVIHNTIEDIWMERRVMEEYRGAAKNLGAVAEAVSKREAVDLKKHPDFFDEPSAYNVGLSIVKTGRLDYTGEHNAAVHDMMPDNYKEWSKVWVDNIAKCNNTKDTIKLARAIEKQMKIDPQLEQNPEDFKFDPDGDQEGQGEAEEGEAEGQGEGEGQEGEANKGQPLGDFDPSKIIEDMVKSDSSKDFENPTGKGAAYRVLTTRNDEVFTRTSTNKRKDARHSEMKTASVAAYTKITNRIGPQVNVMRAKLRRVLLSKENRDWDFGRQQGRMDSKRLTAAYSGAESVYKMRKDREEYDTAVHLLVDLSGSMGGDKEEVAAATAIAFCECLEGSGIKYQVSGFDNGGRAEGMSDLISKAESSGQQFTRVEPLNLFKFKQFGERLQEAKGALSVLNGAASGNNSDRDAVLWASQELEGRPEKRKVLIVLSDGQPANATINIDWTRESAALVKGLKEAVNDISKRIECVGIGIQTDHVKHIYPNSISINKLSDLSGVVFNKLSELLVNGKVRL